MTLEEAKNSLPMYQPLTRRFGGISITRVPGRPDLVIVSDGGSAALVQGQGRTFAEIAEQARQAEVWSDLPGVIDSD